jgi:hypothetical protein
MSAQDLDAQLAQLRQLYEQGVLSAELYRAALAGLGLRPESVFSQQGQRVGAQLNVAGDYITQQVEPGASPEALRRAYLHRLVQQTRRLPLAGVDPKAAGDEQGGELQLSAVYTALLTRQPDEATFPKAPSFREGEMRYLSALETLNRQPLLVLWASPAAANPPSSTLWPCAWPGRRWATETPTWPS